MAKVELRDQVSGAGRRVQAVKRLLGAALSGFISPSLHLRLTKSFQTLGNTVQDRNGTKLDLKNCGQYGFLQQCLSFALPRSTWPF